MEELDYWRLCEELNIVQAALLVAGEDPSSKNSYVENWQPHERPKGYEAAKTAISNALRNKTINGTLIPHYEHDINGYPCGPINDSIDIQESRVEVNSLGRKRGRSDLFLTSLLPINNHSDPFNLAGIFFDCMRLLAVKS